MNEQPPIPQKEAASQPPVVFDLVEKDIPSVIEIQSKRLVNPETVAEDESTRAQTEESGFLVHSISDQELRSVIEEPESRIVKVAKNEQEETIGYLISYDLREWESEHPGWIEGLDCNGKEKQALADTKVLYGRHIAVDEDETSKGVGRALLDSTFTEATKKGYQQFVVEVMSQPLSNNRSKKFVTESGFRKLGTKQEGPRVWDIYGITLETEK
jgi:GNAT superfamily N-acetyltransferase